MKIQWVKVNGVKGKFGHESYMTPDGSYLWQANETGGCVLHIGLRASSPARTRAEADKAVNRFLQEDAAKDAAREKALTKLRRK